MVGLHGTGGAPETEWSVDWKDIVSGRGWAYGGTVERLYEDPSGGHGGLAKNADAWGSMMTYFESLR